MSRAKELGPRGGKRGPRPDHKGASNRITYKWGTAGGVQEQPPLVQPPLVCHFEGHAGKHKRLMVVGVITHDAPRVLKFTFMGDPDKKIESEDIKEWVAGMLGLPAGAVGLGLPAQG